MITVNGQEYLLQLVDTAGQDEYSIFPQTYSIDINGYILVYSVTSNKRVPIMLVGNKKDLHMERQTAVEVFKRTILEAEKMEGGAPQGRTSCSLM
ncbi:unnamed protein product [Coregonus sp. 'balchen']|nr:unnamed protein product [Coregonus sp. 'balchen']